MTETVYRSPWTINYQGKSWTHPRYEGGRLMLLGDTVDCMHNGEHRRSKIVSFTVVTADSYPNGAAVFAELADIPGVQFSPDVLRRVKHNVAHCTDTCRGTTRIRKTKCECGCHL